MKKLCLVALISLIGLTSFTPEPTKRLNYPYQADIFVEDASHIKIRVWMQHIIDDGQTYYADVDVESTQKFGIVHDMYRVLIHPNQGYNDSIYYHFPTKIPKWGIDQGLILFGGIL